MPRRVSRRVFLGALAAGAITYLAIRRWGGPEEGPPAASGTPTTTPTQPPSPTPSPSPIRGEGLYSIDNWPGPDWRLFADTSVWNTPLDTSRVDPNSDVMIRTLVSDGPPRDITADVRSMWGFPFYFAGPQDPVYEIAISGTEAPFALEIDGLTVHCPVGVQTSSGSDGVFRLVEQTDGHTYHFQRATVDDDARVIHAWRSYRLETEGPGFNNPKEPPTGLLPIRPEELVAGFVRHTVGLHAKCLSGHNVAPYDRSGTQGVPCDPINDPTTRLSMGNVVFVDMTVDEVEALDIPTYQKAILKGLAVHGALVGFNGSNTWTLTYEAPQGRTAYGKPDPYRAAGLPSTLSIADALDEVGGWGAKLKVLEPFPRPV
jgi:hypothetical protein